MQSKQANIKKRLVQGNRQQGTVSKTWKPRHKAIKGWGRMETGEQVGGPEEKEVKVFVFVVIKAWKYSLQKTLCSDFVKLAEHARVCSTMFLKFWWPEAQSQSKCSVVHRNSSAWNYEAIWWHISFLFNQLEMVVYIPQAVVDYFYDY